MKILDIGQRIYKIRNGISQEEFGSKIGLSKFAISGYEKNKRPVTDRVVTDICRVFNVNEDWLRTGQGDMFIETNQTIVAELIKKYNLPDLGGKFLECYLKLNDNEKDILEKLFCNFIASVSAGNKEQSAALEIDREVEDYRQELEAERKGATLSVLDGIKEAK